MEIPSDSECKSRIKLRLDHSLKNKEDSKKITQASQELVRIISTTDFRKGTTIQQTPNNINFYNKESVMDLFEDNIKVSVTDIPLALNMSSVTGLADLFEDEIMPKPIPTQVKLLNTICFILTDLF